MFRVKGEKLIPARLLPSAGHRRQRSLSRLTRRWNRRRFAPRLSAQVVMPSRGEADGTSMGTLIWLFGRGGSIACGLPWTVPAAWAGRPRDERIAAICDALRAEMNAPTVDTTPYSGLLTVLALGTSPGWRHRFMTTNWDCLLQREVDKAYPAGCPEWLESTHVFHLNGTVDDRPDKSRRSCFLLESDPIGARVAKLESNLAFANMVWSDAFVVVGMSFECATDSSLLTALGGAPSPVEASRWIVVNPGASALDGVCANLGSKLPGATILPVCMELADWIAGGLAELRDIGVLKRQSQ